jgi:hypothetical protein
MISKIPSLGPDIMGARTEGYKLADVMDQQQLSRMRLQGAQQEQQTLGQAKSLASKYDLGTTEGQQQYAAALTKLDPKLGMEALKAFTESQSGQAKLTDEQIGLYQKKHDILDGALQPMAIAIEDAHKRGMPPAQIEASLMPAFSQTLKTLQEQKLPNGEAILNKDDIKMVSGWLQPGEGNLLRGITGAIASSKTNAKFFADRQKAQGELQTPQTLMGPDGKQHRYLVNKATGEKQDLGVIGAPPARAGAAGAGDGGSAQNQKRGDLMAALGELQVPIPTGMRTPKVLNNFLDGILRRHPGLSATQIAAGARAGYITGLGEKKAVETAGNIWGKVSFAEQEVLQTIPLALEASAQVPRGKFVPLNKLKQMGDRVMSDPNLKQFAMYMTSLDNAYNVLAGRGGTSVEERQHNRSLFDTADSPEALKAALDGVKREAEAAGQAARRAIQSFTPPPGTGGETRTPPPSEGTSPGGGPAKPTQDHNAAMQWAQANPNDPRAKAIIAKAKAAGAQ